FFFSAPADHRDPPSFPTRRSSDLTVPADGDEIGRYLGGAWDRDSVPLESLPMRSYLDLVGTAPAVTKDHELFVCLQIDAKRAWRSEEHTSELQSRGHLVCRLLLEK